ncbi:MAG: hypothetical protein M0042_16075 [Nitrospiraceae bacterium]|nr:hypothetical protein [Nitrospiraceae bacterium]
MTKEPSLKDLGARFAEIERRVKTLVDENSRLRSRVDELEREIASARVDLRSLEQSRERQDEVRQRLEVLLRALDSLGTEERQPEPTPAVAAESDP